jgi:hypothetical protein
MKNKILLEEISRIQELMGKPLINEQWTTIAKLVTNLGDEFAELTAKYADDFTKLANATTDEEAIKILAKLSNAERKFADEIIPHVMKALPDDVTTEIGSIISGAEQQLKAGVNRQIVNNMVEKRLSAIKTQFDEIKTIIRKNINDSLDGYKPPTPKPPTPEPPVDNTLKAKMKKTFEAWDELAPGTLSSKDYVLLNDLWFRGLRAKINFLLNNLMNQFKGGTEKSMEKIVGLIKRISQAGEDFEEKKIIFKALDSEIEALRKNEDFAKEQVYKVISDEVDKKLGMGKGYKLVEKLKANDPLSEKAQSYWSHLIDDTYIGKMFPSFKKTGEKLSGVKNFIHRSVMTITTGNFRKTGEVFEDFFRKYGAIKGAFRWYFGLWFIHRTIWPALIATVDTFYTQALIEDPNLKFEDWWSAYRYYVKERVLDMFTEVKPIYDAEAKKYVPSADREFSWQQTLKAFTWMWDDISSGFDWHVSGGTRRLFQRLENRVREEAENAENTVRENVPQMFGGYKDELPSFVDYQIDATYTPEEADQATYDEVNKIYTTFDGKKYKFIIGSDGKGTFTKAQQ